MFMDSRINEGLSDYTLARYNQITKQYIVGKPFGEKPLSKVSREDVLNIRNSIVNAGHIPTANKFVLVLSAMFNYAINQIKPPPISQNPCYRIKKVDMIAIESPQLKTDNMLDPFKIDSLDLKEKALLAILIGGGLRRGEAFALQKRHIVEVEDGLIIQVRQSIVLLDCKVCKLKPPKSNSGNRDVVVFSEFTPYITDYIGTLNDPSSWLFPKSITNKYGNAPTIASANNLWKSIAKKTGLDKKNFDNKRITMHQMRHTHATIFLDRGLDSKLAQANLGHKSDSLTKSVYQEADVGKRRTAMKNIRNVDVK
jgi:integrase